MRLTRSNVSTILGIIFTIVGVLIGDYLPLYYNNIAIGSIIMGFFFLFIQSVIELNKKYIIIMLRYLWKNIILTMFFIIFELILGSTIRVVLPNMIEQLIAQYSLFGIWVISGFYRTVLEATPVLFKLDLRESVKFYITFSRTRLLYYVLLVIFFLRGGLLYGSDIYSLLMFLFVFAIPSVLFSFFIPFFPSEINWIVTSWTDRKKLLMNIKILQYIYKNKSASLEELKNHTNENKRLKRALGFMIQQRFLVFKNDRFEFHPFFMAKQNIKFFDK